VFEKQVTKSLRRHALAGVSVVAFLAVGVGGWASTTEISGAVVAPGQLVVETTTKKVQHPTGGVVGEINVREGSHVKAGDILVRLDATQTKAELDVILRALDENAARRARMEAELSGADRVSFPAGLTSRRNDPEVLHLMVTETDLFAVRKAARDGQKKTLREQVKGFRDQITSKDKELDWIKQELIGVHQLWDKNLVPFTKVVQLERDAARIAGERGALLASISQAELKILQLDEDMRTDVGKDMAEIRAKNSELVEKRVAAEDRLAKIDIRAPQDGVVHQLQVHTVGGVIAQPNTQSEPIMLIVPGEDELIVEAKARPEDVNQLHVGQRAFLRFTALNQRTTPELNGEVSLVSADVSQDQKRDASYYTIRVKVSAGETERLGKEVKLVPGMPVETYVQTGDRTVLSYLVKPMRDQVMRAFRER
jgi:HlyD family secretion protein